MKILVIIILINMALLVIIEIATCLKVDMRTKKWEKDINNSISKYKSAQLDKQVEELRERAYNTNDDMELFNMLLDAAHTIKTLNLKLKRKGGDNPN